MTTQQTKFTPGPWDFVGGGSRWIRNRQGFEICQVSRPCEANARLIASAPELLGALRDMVAARERVLRDNATTSDPYGTCYTATQISGMWSKAMIKARAAIANATGEPISTTP